MRQYRFILFKDGKPWKGLFDEVDFMNEYDRAFQNLKQIYEERGYDSDAVSELVIPEFFRRFQPARFCNSAQKYISLLREYIVGANENEGSVIYGIDWEDLDRRGRAVFNHIDKEFNKYLDSMTAEQVAEMPEFGVGRGSKFVERL